MTIQQLYLLNHCLKYCTIENLMIKVNILSVVLKKNKNNYNTILFLFNTQNVVNIILVYYKWVG